MISIKRKIISFLITGAALIVLFLVAVNTGSLEASPEQILRGLFVAYDETVATIYSLRFPRILIAMLAGASVAVSGVMLQAVMKNPLADPGIMGISSGAGMAAVLVTAFAPSLYLAVPVFAFLGGVFACGLVYLLSWKGDLSPLRVILTGVAVNAFFTGLMSAGESMMGANYSGAASIVNGNITMKTWEDFRMLFIYAVIGLVLAVLLALKMRYSWIGRSDNPLTWNSSQCGASYSVCSSCTFGINQYCGSWKHQFSGTFSATYCKAAGRKQS